MHWTQIAARQAGVITRRQLLATGLSHSAARQVLDGGRLTSTRWSGVYLAAGAPCTAQARLWASVLHAKAVLSFLSAASWWDMNVAGDGRVHVTTPYRRRGNTPRDVRIHRVALADFVVTEHLGLRVTTRAETVLDCAGWLAPAPAATLFDRALQQRWITTSDVVWRLENQSGRWGNKQLGRLLRQSSSGARAVSERTLLRVLQQAGLAGYQVNYPIPGTSYIVDFAFPQQRIAIELDGWAFHSSVERFRSDRRRGNHLVVAGWTLLRFTWADLSQHPAQVVHTIRAALEVE